MRSVAQRMTPAPECPAEETAEPPSAPAPQALTVVWVYDGPVCVSIVDAPAPAVHDGVCHCGACHGAMRADWDGH
jgi:hypothetical protein